MVSVSELAVTISDTRIPVQHGLLTVQRQWPSSIRDVLGCTRLVSRRGDFILLLLPEATIHPGTSNEYE